VPAPHLNVYLGVELWSWQRENLQDLNKSHLVQALFKCLKKVMEGEKKGVEIIDKYRITVEPSPAGRCPSCGSQDVEVGLLGPLDVARLSCPECGGEWVVEYTKWKEGLQP